MKVVIDTNILLSGIFFGKKPGKILENIQDGYYQPIVSEPVLIEYKAIIVRFLSKKKLDPSQPLEVVDWFVAHSKLVEIRGIQTPECSDPDDIKFLQTAMAGKARYLISGDIDLLCIGKYPGGHVIRPADFLEVNG